MDLSKFPEDTVPETNIKCPICQANFFQVEIPILTLDNGMVGREIDRNWDKGKIPQNIQVKCEIRYYCRKCESRLVERKNLLYCLKGTRRIK